MGSERSENEEPKQNITEVLLTLTFIYVTIGYYYWINSHDTHYLRDNVVCINMNFSHSSIVQTRVTTGRINNYSVSR